MPPEPAVAAIGGRGALRPWLRGRSAPHHIVLVHPSVKELALVPPKVALDSHNLLQQRFQRRPRQQRAAVPSPRVGAPLLGHFPGPRGRKRGVADSGPPPQQPRAGVLQVLGGVGGEGQ